QQRHVVDRAAGPVSRHVPGGNPGAAVDARRRGSCSGRSSGVPRQARSTQDRTLQRTVALSASTRQLMDEWRRQRGELTDPEAWVFPSAKITTPLGRDNAWRWQIRTRLETIGLVWVTFQILRRTHASLARQAGIDPKLVADQLSHGLGVN